MNVVFVLRFLKLRIAFLALQENDQLAQRIRFHCVESQSMKRNSEREQKRFKFAMHVIRKRRDCATNKQEFMFKRRFLIFYKRIIRFCKFYVKIIVQAKS